MATPGDLTEAARQLAAAARQEFLNDGDAPHQGINHWLKPLLVRWQELVKLLAPGTDPDTLRRTAETALAAGQEGEAMPLPALAALAAAQAPAGSQQIGLPELASVLLAKAGATVAPDLAALGDWRSQHDPLRPSRAAADAAAPATPSPAPSAPASVAPPRRPRSTTRALDRFGEDLTALAQAGALAPVVGRDNELELMLEVLCRRTKRNPVLIGPPGVGKTALVELLAQRIAAGEVPERLRQRRVIALPVGALNAGADAGGMHVGELEGRVKELLRESEAEEAIWFIDELHMAIGAGAGSADPHGGLNNILKPALARGRLALVGATTDSEYRRHVEADAAFERRLQPISVGEMSFEGTLQVLEALRDRLSEEGLVVDPAVLAWVTTFAHRQLPNRFFPDKAIDLLEQAAAYASTRDLKSISLETAQEVSQRLVGFPVSAVGRLPEVSRRLVESGLLPAAAAERLCSRLSVTMRGMDWRPARPNAVVLLAGAAVAAAESLARLLAETVLGDASRLIKVDLGAVAHQGESALYGVHNADGTYSDTPIQRLATEPWSVLWLSDVDANAMLTEQFLEMALSEGYLTTPTGKRLYLSNCIVILSADTAVASGGQLGFRSRDEDGDQPVRDLFGDDLLRCIDLVVTDTSAACGGRQAWVESVLVPALTARYRAEGLELDCHASFITWLVQNGEDIADFRDWERLLEETVAPLLAELDCPGPGAPMAVRLTAAETGVAALRSEAKT